MDKVGTHTHRKLFLHLLNSAGLSQLMEITVESPDIQAGVDLGEIVVVWNKMGRKVAV